jgi:hypothetical protein
MQAKREHNKESGMAMVLVITILAALLGIAAVGLSLQLNSTKSTSLVKEQRAALYCAEAGLAGARSTLIKNRGEWEDVLDGPGFPTWYANPLGITGDIDGAPVTVDYSVTIRDDGEADGDLTADTNNTIIVTSKCLRYDSTAPVTVIEVLSVLPQGHSYRDQSGQGAAKTNNQNGS